MNSQQIVYKFELIKGCVLLAVLIFAGCNSSAKEEKSKLVEYYGSSAKENNTLEIPPDLTQTDPQMNIRLPSVINSSNNDVSSSAVLFEPSNVSMLRDGQQRWLLVNAPVAQVWPALIDFWEKDGVKLVTKNPQTGVVETDWLINYADLTSGAEKLFRGLINKLTTSGQRDKYRVRVDRGQEPDTTEIYVTHQGLEEIAIGASTKAVPDYKWAKRPADPGLEIEIMRLIMAELGVDAAKVDKIVQEQDVDRNPRAHLIVDASNEPILVLDSSFSRAWQQVGLALDRAGYTIVGRNREQGGYVIELADSDEANDKKPGFFSRLFRRNSKSEEIIVHKSQIRLVPQDNNKTLIAIATEEGIHDSSETAISLLKQLHGLLK